MTSTKRVRVWDLPQRLFHWSLVACFATAWFTADDAGPVHHWAGYGAVMLVAFRLVWGFVGSHHARFADFVPRPGELWDYLKRVLRRREPPYLGHNPAAAVMILFLLVAVTAIGISGWWLTTDAGWGSGPGEALHEWLAELTLAAVAVHVTAAIYESIHLRENLVRAMIDGTKRAR
ncbi:MAG: cytochrome b/b6 domain-containing protein [Rhodocyclaceae bacterium]|nr:cytochrome b/b6 domain-containing protein [Rhodocyclaceae bacterium]